MVTVDGVCALAVAVRSYRLQHVLTRSALAQRGGFSFSFIADVETGRRRYVNPEQVSLLAHAMGCPEEELWALIPDGRSNARYIPLYSHGT